MEWKNIMQWKDIPTTPEREQALQQLGLQMTRTENMLGQLKDTARIKHLSVEQIKRLTEEVGLFGNSVYSSLPQKGVDGKDSSETTR